MVCTIGRNRVFIFNMRNQGIINIRSFQIYLFVWLILSVLPVSIHAQPPIIQGISRTHGTFNETLTVSGSNFSSNPSDLYLFFGNARGTILNSTANSITASIPGNATTGNISVINKTNGLQGSSDEVFFLSFSGSGFDPSLISSESNQPEATELFDLCLGDFNNDGKMDIAATKVSSATDIDIFKNNSVPGTLSFQKLNKFTNPELDLLSTTSNITCADLDGDGLTDLVITKSGNPRNVVFVLRNISSGGSIKFANSQSFFLPAEDIALKVLVNDLDKDGKPEMIVTNTFDEHVSIFRNQSTVGNISFNSTPYILTYTGSSTTGGLAIADFNNDGYPDIAVNPYIASNAYISVNQSTPGNISFGAIQTLNLAGNLNNLTWGDYDGDGKIDLAATKTIQNQVIVLLNQTATGSGTLSFTAPISISTGAGPWGLSTADMDGNGKPDIIVGLRDARGIDLLKNSDTQGSASFTRVPLTTAYFTRNILAADLDGDNRPDFIYTSFDASASKYNLSIIRDLNCYVPQVQPSGTQVLCSGQTIHLLSNKGYKAEYRWDNNNVIVKDTTENFYDVTQVGTFKVLAITDGGSCQKVSNAVIVNSGSGTVPTTPVITNNGPFCPGDTIKLTTAAVTNAVYSWNGPNGFTASTQNIRIPNAVAAEAGNYTLQETVGTCSSDIVSTTVEVVSMPDFVVSTTDPTTFCIGNSVNLKVTSLSGYTYQWLKNNVPATGATSTNYNVNENGTFNVVITSVSSSCKTLSNSITLSSIVQPSALFTIGGNLCEGINILLTNNSTFDSSQPVNYTWRFGDGSPAVTVENTSHRYALSANYNISLVVEYQNGACSDSLAKAIAVSSNPVCTITENPTTTLCEGVAKSLTVNQNFPNYSWNTGDTTQAITVDSTGSYEVQVTDQNSCQDTCQIDITYNPKPNVAVTANPEQVSPGEKSKLGASGALTYAWTPGQLLDDSTSASPIATVFDSTLFTVVGANADGCTDTASIWVTIPPGNAINVVPAKLFSPNGDGIDDLWVIQNIELYPTCEISIYNGNGSIVYQAKPYNNDWKAEYKGRDLPQGVYFFILNCGDKGSKTGSITVIR